MSYGISFVVGIARAFISGGWLWRCSMAVYGIVVVGGGAATTTTTGRAMLTEWGFPEVGPWQFGTFAAAIGLLFFAARVSHLETKRIRLIGIERHTLKGGGCRFRAKIQNVSTADATALRAVLDGIREINPLLIPKDLSFPLVLTTQQRLQRKEALGEPLPVKRFNIYSKEEKQVELFDIDSLQITIHHENGDEKIILSDCILDFTISGFGVPEKFSVRVDDIDGADVKVSLVRNYMGD